MHCYVYSPVTFGDNSLSKTCSCPHLETGYGVKMSGCGSRFTVCCQFCQAVSRNYASTAARPSSSLLKNEFHRERNALLCVFVLACAIHNDCTSSHMF